MSDPPRPMCLFVKSLKQQRLDRARAIIQQCPEQTRCEVANRMTKAMGITLSTAYAYLRELAREYPASGTLFSNPNEEINV